MYRTLRTTRRTFLAAPALAAGAALVPGGAAAEPATPRDYAFQVFRRGEAVGSHTVRFAQRGSTRVATSEFRVAPRVFGIVVYRYEHIYEEVTEAGRFRRVTSHLNRNGRIVTVSGEAQAECVRLDGSEGSVTLAADAAPLSWWERQRFSRVPIFGTTTGRLLGITWDSRAAVSACHGEVEAVATYDPAGRWIGLTARGEDGNDITYAPA